MAEPSPVHFSISLLLSLVDFKIWLSFSSLLNISKVNSAYWAVTFISDWEVLNRYVTLASSSSFSSFTSTFTEVINELSANSSCSSRSAGSTLTNSYQLILGNVLTKPCIQGQSLIYSYHQSKFSDGQASLFLEPALHSQAPPTLPELDKVQ